MLEDSSVHLTVPHHTQTWLALPRPSNNCSLNTHHCPALHAACGLPLPAPPAPPPEMPSSLGCRDTTLSWLQLPFWTSHRCQCSQVCGLRWLLSLYAFSLRYLSYYPTDFNHCLLCGRALNRYPQLFSASNWWLAISTKMSPQAPQVQHAQLRELSTEHVPSTLSAVPRAHTLCFLFL